MIKTDEYMNKRVYMSPDCKSIYLATMSHLLAGSYTQSTEGATTEDSGGELSSRKGNFYFDDDE